MRVLTEMFEDVATHIEQLDEAAGGKKAYWIEGTFAQANVVNRNKRLYPKGVLENAVAEYMPLVESKRAMGELGHPAGPSLNLDKVSHLITRLEWNGNNVQGRAKILDTPNGRIVKNFIDEGISIGVSTRAMGSVKNNSKNIQEVQNDMKLATADIVADPSAPDAFVQGLFEGKEWIFENGAWTEMDAEATRQSILSARSGKELTEAKIASMAFFMAKLNRMV